MITGDRQMNGMKRLKRTYLPMLLLAAGIAAMLIGILVKQEHAVVFNKAVRICMECIGIG